VTVLYFAWVRQKIGKSEEALALPASVKTVEALVAHLKDQGGGYADAFADAARLRVSVNRHHCGFDTAIHEADEIAFFPPVTGG
jgi:molybdopterin synthase sulfur carrier subunit